MKCWVSFGSHLKLLFLSYLLFIIMSILQSKCHLERKNAKKLQFKKVRSNCYFLKGNILPWKYFYSITFKQFLCFFWSQISAKNSTWVLVFGKKVSNQTKSRENFSSHYIKRLAEAWCPQAEIQGHYWACTGLQDCLHTKRMVKCQAKSFSLVTLTFSLVVFMA